MPFTIPIIVSIIIGVNQALKVVGVPTKFIPGISLVLGVAAGIFFIPGLNVQETIFNGISVGLGSIGLFAVAKSTAQTPEYYKVLADGEEDPAADQAPEVTTTPTIGF